MNRDALKKRIAALRDKTTARGCTEAEALAAAEKAAALMQEYGLTDGDIVMDEQSVRSKTKGYSPRELLWNILGICTNTAIMLMTGVDTRRIFIGLEPGPSVAAYLYVVLDRAIDREIATFKAGPFYRRRRNISTRRQAVSDFTAGLVDRLAQRIFEMFSPTRSSEAWQNALKARDQRYPDAETINARARKDIRFDTANASGRLAGDNVSLAHGVNGGSEIKLIGGAA
ncbi:hypothetical protein H4S14_004141 [Agrobacterium vitis]|nr:hypothetical protein [Agrobacterium vitis]MBE1440367.1 hypothetical protein [Agrobacterium vitis]